jgi:hypothetical protein
MIIACDFDGCLCEDKFPGIGAGNNDLIKSLIGFRDCGCKIILWTCRTGGSLWEAVEWCNNKGLIFDAINEDVNDVKQHFEGSGNRKIYADVYIDDKAVNYSLMNGECYGKTIDETFEYARNIAKRRRDGNNVKKPAGDKQKDIKSVGQNTRVKRTGKGIINKRVHSGFDKRVRRAVRPDQFKVLEENQKAG